MQISFRSVAGAFYGVEREWSLGAPWVPVAGANHIVGTGQELTVTDHGAAALLSGFYRVIPLAN